MNAAEIDPAGLKSGRPDRLGGMNAAEAKSQILQYLIEKLAAPYGRDADGNVNTKRATVKEVCRAVHLSDYRARQALKALEAEGEIENATPGGWARYKYVPLDQREYRRRMKGRVRDLYDPNESGAEFLAKIGKLRDQVRAEMAAEAQAEPEPEPEPDDEPSDWGDCALCGGPIYPMGVLGNREHGQCRHCGIEVSRDIGGGPEANRPALG